MAALMTGGAILAAPGASAGPLDPQAYIRNFRLQAARHGGRIEWVYTPGSSLEPFLDFYPGDDCVSSWALSQPAPDGFGPANARSFAAEARRRGHTLRLLS